MASSTPYNNQDGESISYLSQAEATAVDELLMGELGFSIDQLMVSFKLFQLEMQKISFVSSFKFSFSRVVNILNMEYL